MKDIPQVSLCMIVKNEADNLRRCLDSVQGIAEEIVIVDTGSQDDTVSIARSYGALVFYCPWNDDFSAARNHALEQANGEWILVLDADEELSRDAARFILPCLTDQKLEGLLFTMVNYQGEAAGADAETYLYTKMFRNRPVYRYTRAVHEQLQGVPADLHGFVPLSQVLCYHYGYLLPEEQKKGKAERNLRLVKAAVACNPDSFNYFNLAVEYNRSGQLEKALSAAEYSRSGLDTGASYGSKLYKLLATILLQLGRNEEAVELCREGISNYHNYPDLLFLQGAAYLSLARFSEAAGYFKQCLAMGGDSPRLEMEDAGYTGFRAYLALGDAYTGLGSREEALGYYHRALQHNPSCTAAVLRIAELLAGQEERLGRELSKYTFSGESLLEITQVLVALKFYTLALDLLQQLSGSNWIDQLRAYCLIKLGRFSQGLEETSRNIGGNRDISTEAASRFKLYASFCRRCLGDYQAENNLQFSSPEEAVEYCDLLWGEGLRLLNSALRQFPGQSDLEQHKEFMLGWDDV